MQALLQEPLYDSRTNISIFMVPGTKIPLHVPIMKLHHDSTQTREMEKLKSTAGIKEVHPKDSTGNKSDSLPVCQRGCSQRSQLYPGWPARKYFENVNWLRLGTPHASLFKHCGPYFHWYCGHLQPSYVQYHRNVHHACYQHLGIFERPDVRLVLDIGGASAAMAQVLHDIFDDQIITITGSFWSTVCHVCHGIRDVSSLI